VTEGEVFELFSGIRAARIDDGYAPHKPLLLILLEMIYGGHANHFTYSEIDSKLKRLLERFGSASAADARNQPFLRLQNDGVLEIFTSYSALVVSDGTPTALQLLDQGAYACMNAGAYKVLAASPQLIFDIAHSLVAQFMTSKDRAAVLLEAAPALARYGRKYWWVSQNKTYSDEVRGNFMWSPKTNVNGRTNQFYEFMTMVMPGDIVFSFADTKIKAIGVALEPAMSCPKPTEFGIRGNAWLDDGWLVEVAFVELFDSSIKPADYMGLLAPMLPDQYSPIRADGKGNQMYLASVPRAMGMQLMELIGPIAKAYVDDVYQSVASVNSSLEESEEIEGVEQRDDISPTEKQRLVSARRGQGIFRVGVSLVEKSCRVTLTTNKRHLIASHIKPWAQSTDEERLSRFNGLLLAPHVDHLFDKGYISFRNDGSVLVSRLADREVLGQWHIDPAAEGGPLKQQQEVFMEYHRDAIFLR
jgi:hypothetical protein